jgi:carboxyvinyl-carboxyphosphonate phosphorylmutase
MDWDFLGAQRVRVVIQGHAPISAAMAAVHATLKAVREGAAPRELKNLASAELMESVTRGAVVKQRSIDFLGLKK